jgi:hypothetical protein
MLASAITKRQVKQLKVDTSFMKAQYFNFYLTHWVLALKGRYILTHATGLGSKNNTRKMSPERAA